MYNTHVCIYYLLPAIKRVGIVDGAGGKCAGNPAIAPLSAAALKALRLQRHERASGCRFCSKKARTPASAIPASRSAASAAFRLPRACEGEGWPLHDIAAAYGIQQGGWGAYGIQQGG